MTTINLGGRTKQTVINRLRRNGYIVDKIKKVNKEKNYMGMNEYKVTYHKKKQ